MIDAKSLLKIPVFFGLRPESREAIASFVHRRRYDAGEVIFREGEDAKEIFFLESGEVRIAVPAPQGDPVAVDLVEPGGIFGWSALVPPHTFTATARAEKPSEVLVIDGELLKRRMREDPDFAWSVFEALLRTMSDRIAGLRVRLAVAQMAD